MQISESKVLYHVSIMVEAGLIKANCYDQQDGSNCLISRLTWDGHEFLDQIKSDTVWNEIKQTASQKGLDLTLGLATKIAVKIIDQLI